MKKLMIFGSALMMALVTFGSKRVVWNGTATSSWSDSESWSGGVKPERGDGIWVRAGKTMPVTDADMEMFQSVAYVQLPANAVTAFNLANDYTVTNCFQYTGSSTEGKGKVTKTGDGQLYVNYSKYNPFDGTTQVTINGGSVKMGKFSTVLMPNVEVNSPGTLIFQGNGSIYGLSGNGSVTNEASGSYVYFSSGSAENPYVFSGRLFAGVNLDVPGTGHQHFTSTENDAVLVTRFYGELGVAVIGDTDRAGSVGCWDSVSFRPSAGTCPTLKYLGTGETTAKSMQFYSGCPMVKIDAGTTGGVTFTGEWQLSSYTGFKSLGYKFLTVVLTGENANPCTVKAGMYDMLERASTYWRKEGTGTWRFERTRDTKGVMDVRRGILEFDSIGERGVLSALGTAEFTCEDVSGNSDLSTANRVDYALVVGDGTTAASDAHLGTLKYIGTTAATCATRPLRVRGAGGLVSETAALTFRDITPLAATGDHTLVLGGAASGNVASSVTNGPNNTLSIVKQDAGVWTLISNVNVKAVSVKAGTLTIGAPKYEFYRWKITANKWGVGGAWIAAFNGFALMDKDGNLQNLTLGANGMATTKNGQPETLEPGEICYNKSFSSTGDRYPSKSFHWLADENKFEDSDAAIDVTVEKDDATTHPIVYFRLSEGAKPIAKYDVLSNSNTNRSVSCWELAGSIDGKNWDVLHTVGPDFDSPVKPIQLTKGSLWCSNGTTTRGGFEIAEGPVQNVSFTSAAAAAGATLAVSEVADATPISELVYDVQQGAGTLKQLAFNSTGVISILNTPAKFRSDVTFKYTLVNCTGSASLANWTLKYNGEAVASNRYAIVIGDDGTVTVKCLIPPTLILVK